MPDYKDFGDAKAVDQDKIVFALLNDGDFLKQLLRREVDPVLFTGIYRQRVVEFAYWFFERYKRPPKAAVVEILTAAGNGFRPISSEDSDGYVAYLEKLTGMEFDFSELDYLLQRMNEFLYRRTILTTSSLLTQDLTSIDRNPEGLESIIRESVFRLDRIGQTSLNLNTVLDDDFENFSRPMTRFMVEPLDRALGGGLRAPNLAVIQAYTGRGKTWAAAHLAKMSSRFGYNALVIINEMHSALFKLRLRMSVLGVPLEDITSGRVSYKECRERMARAMMMGANIYIYDDTDKMLKTSDIPNLVDSYEQEIGKPIDCIIIDSADDLQPPEITNAAGTQIIRKELDRTSPTYSFLRAYTQNKMKLVVTTTQSQRRGESIMWLKSGTVGDDINKSRRATVGLSINAFDSEIAAGYIRFLLYKNTNGPADVAAWCKHGYNTGQLVKQWGEVRGLNLQEYQRMLERDGGFLGNKKPEDQM